MIRKTRNLLISLIVLVLIAAAFALLHFREQSGETSETAETKAPEVLSNYLLADLRLVSIQNAEGNFQFTSSDGENWMISPVPENFRAVKDRTNSAVRTLSNLQSETIIAEGADESRLSEYGLITPEAVITYKDREGNSSTVEIGATNPSQTGRYARLKGSDTVVLLHSYSIDPAFRSPETYRDMILPAVNPGKLASFEYRHNGITFSIAPREDEDNYTAMVSPFVITSPWKNRYDFDADALQALLSEKAPLPSRVVRYLDGADYKNEAFGLDDADADFLKIADEDGNVLDLVIGNPDGNGMRYVRYRDHEDSIFLLKDSDLALVNTDPFMFVSKYVFLGSIYKVSQVKVERGSDTWVMKREERGEPDDTDDDRFIVNTLEVPKKEFTTVYQNFISIQYEGKAVGHRTLKSPEVRISISCVKPGVEPKIIRYWPYDETYYQVSIDNNPIEFIAGRYQVDSFIEDLAALSEYGS